MVNIVGLAKGGGWLICSILFTIYITWPISNYIIDILNGIVNNQNLYLIFTLGNILVHLIVIFLGFYVLVWGVPKGIDKTLNKIGG